jgi:membrane protein implicated in regulation of membrane protease activity
VTDVLLAVGGWYAAGILVSLAVWLARPRDGREEFTPLAFLAEVQGWVWFLLWPLWIYVELAERRDPPPAPRAPDCPAPSRVGCAGLAAGDLRPHGVVLIDGCRHAARSDGTFIPAHADVTVVREEFGTLVVRRVGNADPS